MHTEQKNRNVLLAAAMLLLCSGLPARTADAPAANLSLPVTPLFATHCRVLFQGDSITDGGRDRSNAYLDHTLGHGYPYLIAANYGGHSPERKLVFLQKVFDEAVRRAPAEYWLFDGVHPFYAGHQLMADEWIRTVKAAWPK